MNFCTAWYNRLLVVLLCILYIISGLINTVIRQPFPILSTLKKNQNKIPTQRRLSNKSWWKKLRETQTLRAGFFLRWGKKIRPTADPFPGAQVGQYLTSWRWSLPSPINRVWWGSMHAISSYRGNRPTNIHTNPQTGPTTIHCAAKLNAQCSKPTI